MEIKKEDLLTSFSEFEENHSIKEERNDIPRRFLGFCPSKYFKVVDMDVEKLSNKVNAMFQKFLLKNPQ